MWPTSRTLKGHTGRATSVAFTRDGSWLVSASEDRTIKIWDVAGAQALRTFEGHTSTITSLAALSPDGSRLASASDQTIVFEDVVGDRKLRTLKGHKIKVWDVTSGRELRTLTGHAGGVRSVAFSPDGCWLASGSVDQTVKIWDAGSGEELRTLKGHGGMVESVAFSPDGSWLASGSVDQTVKIWDAASGQELRTLSGHRDQVRSVAFSPDGSRVASGSVDQTVKIWDAASGQELRTLKEQTGGVLSVAFSPDGHRLVASGNDDGTLTIWDAQPLTPELLRHREAHGLVEYLCQKSPSKEKVVKRIRADRGITEEVRQDALSLLDRFWARLIRAEADAFLHPLFAKGLLHAEVLETVNADRTLRDEVRQLALVVAGQYSENALKLNGKSWLIVRRPDATPAEYQLALRQAEAACRGEPENGVYLNTLGIAQYRMHKYSEAIATLTRSEKLNTAALSGPHPADLAFLALAHSNLGHNKEAQSYRQRLQDTAKQRWAGDPETQGFIREVEAHFTCAMSRPGPPSTKAWKSLNSPELLQSKTRLPLHPTLP